MHLWAVPDGQLLSSSRMLDVRANDADLNGDGSLAVSADTEGGLTVWETSTGLPLWNSLHESNGNQRFSRCFFEDGGRSVVGVPSFGKLCRKELVPFTDLSRLDRLIELAARLRIDSSGRTVRPEMIPDYQSIEEAVAAGLP